MYCFLFYLCLILLQNKFSDANLVDKVNINVGVNEVKTFYQMLQNDVDLNDVKWYMINKWSHFYSIDSKKLSNNVKLLHKIYRFNNTTKKFIDEFTGRQSRKPPYMWEGFLREFPKWPEMFNIDPMFLENLLLWKHKYKLSNGKDRSHKNDKHFVSYRGDPFYYS